MDSLAASWAASVISNSEDGLPQIAVERLCKHYQIHENDAGLAGSLRSFFHRKYVTLKAVDDLTFHIRQGEIVGFLGPNGAGKTTPLKVLAGLLYPTSGCVSVLGFTPRERREEYLKSITLIMEQKQQLAWDLPPIETFLVNAAIYDIQNNQFKRTLGELTELLELGPLHNWQVRKLSLGERMKCELAAALLHRPKVLFLDEPTIGLDVTTQTNIRRFIAVYNEEFQATVILTSHYMVDVSALCRRMIVIDHGRLLYDGGLRSLSERIAPHSRVLAHGACNFGPISVASWSGVIWGVWGIVPMRYIRLLGIFYRNCLLQELEYRVNLVANILMSGFWLAWAALGLSVLF